MNNVTADRMQEEVTMAADDILGVLNVFNDHVVGVIAIDVQELNQWFCVAPRKRFAAIGL